jgi:hypothetical protein
MKDRTKRKKPKTEREKVAEHTKRLIKRTKKLRDDPLADQVPFLCRSKWTTYLECESPPGDSAGFCLA